MGASSCYERTHARAIGSQRDRHDIRTLAREVTYHYRPAAAFDWNVSSGGIAGTGVRGAQLLHHHVQEDHGAKSRKVSRGQDGSFSAVILVEFCANQPWCPTCN